MTDTTLPDRALSIRQPWAWAILNAGKDIENRPRRFNYRGPICIHASLYKPNEDDQAFFIATMASAQSRDVSDVNMIGLFAKYMPRGGIIGTAEIVDCVDHSDSPWFFGPHGLILRNVQPVRFIPVKGALGLFRWKEKLTKGVEA